MEIRDGEDRETENDTPDFYCSLEPPVLPHHIRELEKIVADLYHSPKTLEEIGLDLMILSPEMIDTLPATPLTLAPLPIYMVREEWAIQDKADKADHIFLSEEEARMKLYKCVRAFKEEDMGDWLDHLRFTEESSDISYICYLEEEYCSNHYTIEILQYNVIPGIDFIHKVGAINTEYYMREDIEARMESDHPDITPEERTEILKHRDINKLFSDKMENHDTFWEIYWKGIDNVIEELLETVHRTDE